MVNIKDTLKSPECGRITIDKKEPSYTEGSFIVRLALQRQHF